MNRFEQIKQGVDPDRVGRDIRHLEPTGGAGLSEQAVHRLRLAGIAVRHGRAMVRVRVPAGRCSAEQLIRLGELAHRYADGRAELTGRGQLQLRCPGLDRLPPLVDGVEEVGLSTLQTLMDSVRNLVTCPLAGLTERELFDVEPVIRAIERELVGHAGCVNLPRKVNLFVSACPGPCGASHLHDIALVPARDAQGRPGLNLLAGGKASGNSLRSARSLDVFCLPQSAARLVFHLVGIYRDHGPRRQRSRARLAHMIDEWGTRRVRTALEGRWKRPLPRAGEPVEPGPACSTTGVIVQREPDRVCLGLHVHLGILTAGQLVGAGRLAARYGDGQVRLTTQQSLLLTGIARRKLSRVQGESLRLALPHDPHPVDRLTRSCIGRPHCALAAIDTKAWAGRIAAELKHRAPHAPAVRIAWSACRAGCGRHLVADIGLVGRRARVNGRLVDAADIYLGGRPGPPPKAGRLLARAVPCTELTGRIAALLEVARAEARPAP